MLDFLDFEAKFQQKLYCNAWVATAIVGSAVIGGVSQYLSAENAADAQTTAANRAADTSLQMYHTTRGDLAPYRNIGNEAGDMMRARIDNLVAPISVNPDDLQNSDYYKFAMYQGQKAVQNSAAARGLGSSGAALKGAAAFAKGLATDTYKTAWDMEAANKKNAYDRLKGLIDMGQTAAAGTGTAGTAAAKGASDAYIGAGDAQAAAANQQGQAVRGVSDRIGGYMQYQGMYGGNNNPTPNYGGGADNYWYG